VRDGLSFLVSHKRPPGTDDFRWPFTRRAGAFTRISNRGAEPLWVYRPLLWGRRGGLVLEVIDASGHQIEPQQLDEDSVIPTTLNDPQSFLQIPSDYEWGVIRRDKTSNIFKTPGRYTLRLKYLSPAPKKYFAREGGQWATEDGPVFSEPVTIDIE